MKRVIWHSIVGLVIMLVMAPMIDGDVFAAGKQRYKKTMEDYQIPNVTLINQHNEKVNLVEYLKADKPVMVEFIFVTCTTICPIMSIGFTNLQKDLGPKSSEVRFVSISIDPAYDRPKVMREYLERYNAKPGWDFLTGRVEDIAMVMKAFDAYVADKMNHQPLTFMRSPKIDNKWVRLDGLMGGKDMLREYEALK
jgi:protein SCO1/2